jgi:hypothetical protein
MDARLTPSALAIAATVYCLEAYIWRASRILARSSPPAARPRDPGRGQRPAQRWSAPGSGRARTRPGRRRCGTPACRPGWWCRSPPAATGTPRRGRPGRRWCRPGGAATGPAGPASRPPRCRPAQLIQDLIQRRPGGQGAAGRVEEDPEAAGLLERIDLQVGVLVAGGGAGVAEEVGHARECRITHHGSWLCDVDFGHGFWTRVGEGQQQTAWVVAERYDSATADGPDSDQTDCLAYGWHAV